MATFSPWLRSASSWALVEAMDADVLITIAFFLEAVLFALVGGIVVIHEVHEVRAHAAAEERTSKPKASQKIRRTGAVETRRRERTS